MGGAKKVQVKRREIKLCHQLKVNIHLVRLPGRKTSVGMGSSRLTEERVDIIYKVDLSRIKTTSNFYLTLSVAKKDILLCICLWTKGKFLIYDMHFIESPKSRFSSGH